MRGSVTQTILIADDHPLFRQAMAMAATAVVPEVRIVEAGTLAAAASAVVAEVGLRLILLDLKMPGAVGYSGIALLHAERPDVPILVVSSAEGSAAPEEARAFGAVGFLRKDADLGDIEAAIAQALKVAVPVGSGVAPVPRAVAAQGADGANGNGEAEKIRRVVASLTPTQLKVLLAVLEGQLNKQIAHALGISEATVKAHMTAIMRKLDVRNRTQAALVARSLGLDLV
jgi:DNA-binding NarL/FixJ family response regulator